MVSAGIPTAGELGGVVSGLPQPVLFIGLAVLLVGYYIYSNVDTRAFKKYEKKPLGEKVFEDIEFRLKKLGKRTNKGLFDKGDKEVKDTIGYWDTYEIREDDTITPVSELKDAENEDIEEVIVLMKAPDSRGILGKFAFLKWLVWDYLDKHGSTTIYIFNRENVDIRGRHFAYDEEVQFLPTTYAGVNSDIMCQATKRSANVINQIATADMEGEMLNSMTEFLKKVEHFEIEHLKKMNEYDREEEMERARQEGLID